MSDSKPVLDAEEAKEIESWGDVGEYVLEGFDVEKPEEEDDPSEDETQELQVEQSGEVENEEPEEEGEVDWQSRVKELEEKLEEESKARAGILGDLTRVRSEARRQASEYQEHIRLGNERLAQIAESMKGKQEEAEPDFSDDPLASIAHRQEKLEGKIDSTLQAADQQRHWEAFQAQVEQERNVIGGLEAEWVGSQGEITPEIYEDSLDHLRGMVSGFYTNIAGVPEEVFAPQLPNLMLQWASNIRRAGRNPAEVFYNYSKSLGFSPSSNGNQEEAVDEKPKKKAAKVSPEPTVSAAKTISRAPHKSSSGRKITFEDLAEMPPEEFQKIADDENKWKAINQDGFVVI